MKAAGIRARPEREADAARDLVTGRDRREQRGAVSAVALRHRKRGRDYHGARVHETREVRVVEVEAVRERAVEQRGVARGEPAPFADNGRGAVGRAEGGDGSDERGRRVGVDSRAGGDADEVE